MRGYDERRGQDWEELQSRLDALDGPDRVRRRRKRKRNRPNAGRLVLGLLVIAAVMGILTLILATAFGGGDGENEISDGPATITVAEGDSLSVVADKLAEAGIIENATLFTIQARLGGDGTDLKTGEYTFESGTGGDEIVAELTAGQEIPTFTVTLPEGLTLEQTARSVAEQTDITEEAFLEASRRTDYGYAFLDDPDIASTEGFLFPKSYEFEEGTDAEGVVNRLLEQYLLETQDLDFESAAEQLGLTEYELVTVASLIERETRVDGERPLVASVVYNRLDEPMRLQIDATVQYALGRPRAELSLEDLEVDSPYNTYQNDGLPPGPIANPSLASIQAALEPADTNYTFYVLEANDRDHYFTDDYDDFLRAKAEAGR